MIRRFANKGKCKSLLRRVVNEKIRRTDRLLHDWNFLGASDFLVWDKMRHYQKQLEG